MPSNNQNLNLPLFSRWRIWGFFLFGILFTNEIGSLTGISDLYIQMASAIGMYILLPTLGSKLKLSFTPQYILFLIIFASVCLHGLTIEHDEKSKIKLMETIGIYSPLLLIFLYSQYQRKKILIALIELCAAYQLIMLLGFVVGLQSGSIDVVSRGGAISDAYHRVGRMAVVGSIGYLALVVFESSGYRASLLLTICSILGPLNILLAANRAGLVAVAICLLAVLLLALWRDLVNWKSLRRFSLLFGLIALSGSIYFSEQIIILEKVLYAFSRFEGIITGQSSSFERLDFYASAIELGLAHFPFGVGYGLWPSASGFSQNRHPHNIFLEFASEMGFIVFVFLALLWTSLKRSPDWQRIVILGILIQAMIGGDISDNRVLLYLLVI